MLGESIILHNAVVFGLFPMMCLPMLGIGLISVLFGEKQTYMGKITMSGRSLWLGLVLLFFLLGMGRARQVKLVCQREAAYGLDGKEADMEGRIASITESGEWVVLVLKEVEVMPEDAEETPEQGGEVSGDSETADDAEIASELTLRRLQIYAESAAASDPELCIGKNLRVKGECSAFLPSRNPGSFDYQLYYRSQDLSWRMFADSMKITGGRCRMIPETLRRIRGWVSGRIGLLMPEQEAGITTAVLTGDKSGLSDEIRDLYQENGISHLLAVSGLHLSLVSLLVYGLCRRVGAGYGLAGVLAGGALCLYALMTGASSSVLRALIMVLCGFLAAYLGRTYDLLSALSLAAFLMLWSSPYRLSQSGVQLSFGAVFGIGAVSPGLLRLFPSEDPIQKGLMASLGMQAAMLPLVLYHFFEYPLYGILVNLFVVPLLGLVIGTGAGAVLLSTFSMKAGIFLAGSGCSILLWYEWLCHLAERLPGHVLILGRPQLWQIGLYYGILAAVLLGKRCRILLIMLPVVLLPLPRTGLEVTFLDVGQGDGICMEVQGLTVLNDGGSTDEKKLGETCLEPFLKSKGIRRVDYAVISHGDQDHISGIRYLLQNDTGIRIHYLVLPAAGYGDESYAGLCEDAAGCGTQVLWMEQGERISKGDFSLTCIYPEGNETNPLPTGTDRNDHSLVLRAEYRDFSLLLTGDMSGEGEAKLLCGKTAAAAGEIDVLKVAHHGSEYSTTEGWVEAVSPAWAVVSYGAENRYGHPGKTVMERLQRHGIPVFETAKSGAVILHTDGKRVRWKEWRRGGSRSR